MVWTLYHDEVILISLITVPTYYKRNDVHQFWRMELRVDWITAIIPYQEFFLLFVLGFFASYRLQLLEFYLLCLSHSAIFVSTVFIIVFSLCFRSVEQEISLMRLHEFFFLYYILFLSCRIYFRVGYFFCFDWVLGRNFFSIKVSS